MKKNKFPKNNKQKGFVLLFAVLISTLVLAVGISMISIALKQVVLSGSGRDSQYAFYAANTGAECATYWDLASSSVFTSVTIPGASVTCLEKSGGGGNALAAKWALNNTGISIWNGSSVESDPQCYKESNNITRTSNPLEDPDWCFNNTNPTDTYAKFRIAYSDKPYCADVIVRKQYSGGLVATTTVTSRGYNTCDTSNPRRIERALEFSY